MMRKGVKPPTFPTPGTFWSHKGPKRPGDESTRYDIVAIMDVRSGYARMGMRSDIIEYTSGLAYAMNDITKQHRYKKTLERSSFLDSFDLVEDDEELSETLGMQALVEYV